MNTVYLIGFLGKDAELHSVRRKDNSNFEILRLSVATKEQRKDKSVTEWHNLQATSPYLIKNKDSFLKGSLVSVTGKLRTTSYEDPRTKEKKYFTYIEVSQLNKMEKLGEETAVRNQSKTYSNRPSYSEGNNDAPF